VTASTSTPTSAAAMTATETAGRSAMHNSAEAGLAAEGMLVYHAAVVESAECAGALTGFHVRRDEPAIGSMVDRSTSIALDATWKTMSRSAPKIRAMYSKPAVDKGGTPGDEPVVIENYEPVVPIGAPVVPTPVMVEMPSDRKARIEKNKRTDKETFVEIAWIGQQGIPVYEPGIILGKIDDLWIRRFDNYRLVFGCHSLLRRSFKSAGALRPLAHNLDGIEDIL
jgi:hypothetical protein